MEHTTGGLLKLAIGGTAVGTGLNASAGFGRDVAAEIAAMTGAGFRTAADKFTAQDTLDRLMRAHGGLKAAAMTLLTIAHDPRWLGSGPRAGIGELILLADEPASSAAAVNFELNAFRPVLISNYLRSALIMADLCDHLRDASVPGGAGTRPARSR